MKHLQADLSTYSQTKSYTFNPGYDISKHFPTQSVTPTKIPLKGTYITMYSISISLAGFKYKVEPQSFLVHEAPKPSFVHKVSEYDFWLGRGSFAYFRTREEALAHCILNTPRTTRSQEELDIIQAYPEYFI